MRGHSSISEDVHLIVVDRTSPSAPMELTPPPSPASAAAASIPIFRPMECSFDDCDSVVLKVSEVTPYLDRTLKSLGLDVEARTSFITYEHFSCS